MQTGHPPDHQQTSLSGDSKRPAKQCPKALAPLPATALLSAGAQGDCSVSGKRNPNYTIPPLPPPLPTTLGEGGSMHVSIPTHTCVGGVKGQYQPVLSLQDTPA